MKALLDRSFGEVSFKFRRWSAELAEDQSLEDTLVPEFWKSQADTIAGYDKKNPKGRGDIIEVRKLDTGVYAELIVTEVGAGYVRVRPLKAYEPLQASVPDTSPMITKWNIGKKMHEVLRKSDNQVMASNFQTKASAVEWIANHLKSLQPVSVAA